MKNISTKLAVVLTVAMLAVSQVYAEETVQQAEVSVTNEAECQVLLKKESKISNFLHSCPIISRILNRQSKMDYVAEDILLTNYMLGTPAEVASRMEAQKDTVAEERMLENYMLASTEVTEETEEVIAEAVGIDPFAAMNPVAFAADLDEETAMEDDFDFLQIDFVEEDSAI